MKKHKTRKYKQSNILVKSLSRQKIHANNFDLLFKEVKWEEHYPDLEWKEVYNTIKEMKVIDDYKLEWEHFDEEKLIELLVNGHDFSLERVKSKLDKIKDKKEELSQKGLGSFF